MKRTTTFLIVMLLLSIFSFGQNAVDKNKPYRINNPSEAFKRESMKVSHPSLRQINKSKPHSSNLQSALAPKQRLDSTISQFWNDSISQFENYYKYEYIYDSMGKIIQSITFDGQGNHWENNNRNTNTYDINGNLTQEIQEEWQDSQWMNTSKSENTFDTNGNTTQIIYSNWNDSQWENWNKIEHVYDSYGNWTQYKSYQWVDNLWVNNTSYKYEYIYDSNGNMIQDISSEWVGNQWNNVGKSVYTYDSNNKEIQWIVYHWIGNQWTGSDKLDNTWDANGNNTQTIYSYGSGNQWFIYGKNVYTYDSLGNQIQIIKYSGDGSLWTETDKYEYTFNNSYSASDIIAPFDGLKHMLTSSLDAIWDQTSNDWAINNTISYYYSEQNVNAVSEINKGTFIVYPNPVTEFLSINVSGNYRSVTFELYDIQGRKLMDQVIKSDEPISLKSLQKGMYIYNLITDGQKHTGKLVKE